MTPSEKRAELPAVSHSLFLLSYHISVRDAIALVACS